MVEFLKHLMDPESIIRHGGLALLLAVIFAENGIAFGFFLPGDSLIFLAGLLCATKPELLGISFAMLALLMFLAAIAGSLFGYYTGIKVGPPLFEKKESIIFKKKYLEMTQSFYRRHGGKTLVLGRFLPIIRTFAPIIAGVIKVPFSTFMVFNVIGGAMWIIALGLAGHYLGTTFPIIEEFVGYIIIGFICITTVILIRAYIKEKRDHKASTPDSH